MADVWVHVRDRAGQVLDRFWAWAAGVRFIDRNDVRLCGGGVSGDLRDFAGAGAGEGGVHFLTEEFLQEARGWRMSLARC